ncbi:MAG: LamG domain-containing protein, partial [Lentisphaeria bacterium]|nr:LamG domain-containing protein [Lentisphaeria bacterium]
MRRKTEAIALAVSAVLAAWPVLAANEQRVTQKWELESTPDSEVIALWQFSAGQPGQNSRADGAAAALAPRGRFSAEGKFGGGLQCLGVSEPEAPTGALVANHPELSPQGAFSVDLWARADAHGAPGTRAFLIDNKGYYYVSDRPRANNGFMLFLLRPKNHPDDVVTLNVGLGFGEASIFASSVPIAMPVGTWRHLAFTYDGAGTVKLYADSEKIAERHFPGVGAIAPSTRDLAIGERGGSLFQGFTGLLDDVCIRRGARPYHSGKIDCGVTSKRRVFLRHEKIGALRMTFTNSTGSDLQQPRLLLASRGQSTTVPLPETWPLDGEIPVSFQLDTTLR